MKRTSGVWTQEGLPFVGTGATNTSEQGAAVAIAADGNTLIDGSPTDNAPGLTRGVGATWVFGRRSLAITAPAAAVAGVPVSINVLAEEPNNVVGADFDGNLRLTSTDPHAVLPMNTVLTQGVGMFVATLQTPGIQTISADYDPSPLVSGTANTISVRVAAVQISPANLTLAYTAGTDPSGVAATLSVAADAAISFSAASGNSSIVLSPASGPAPATLTVRPNPAGLEPGSYSTTLTLTFADSRTFSVPVTLSVAAPIIIAALVNAASYAAGPGAPNTLIAAFGSFSGCTSGAQVSIDGAPTAVFASSTTQINFLVPATVAGEQTASVQITCGGITSQSVPMQIAGEFSRNFHGEPERDRSSRDLE